MKRPGCSFLQGDCERRQNSGKKHEIKFLGKRNDGVYRTRSFDIGKQTEKHRKIQPTVLQSLGRWGEHGDDLTDESCLYGAYSDSSVIGSGREETEDTDVSAEAATVTIPRKVTASTRAMNGMGRIDGYF